MKLVLELQHAISRTENETKLDLGHPVCIELQPGN
jgi:hypothetical protein